MALCVPVALALAAVVLAAVPPAARKLTCAIGTTQASTPTSVTAY